MPKLLLSVSCVAVCLFLAGYISGQDRNKPPKPIIGHHNSRLPLFAKQPAFTELLQSAVNETLENFRDTGLKKDEIAATLIKINSRRFLTIADFRGATQIYPASVVKMFYMVALHKWLEDGRVKLTPELERGLRNMIVDSGNESTGYVLDVLTGTTSGPEISDEREFAKWSYKRNAVNRYFESLGYRNISINQKTHCEDAWGREQQFRGYANRNRNKLTTNATARLLSQIVLGKAVTQKRSMQMMGLIKRDWEKPVKDPFDKEFISHALVPGTKLWSKEGWTSKTRHDAAYIETPNGHKLILVIFTENHAKEQEIIPSIARKVIKGLGDIKREKIN